MSEKKVAVILSGCGVYDGSEIYESTLTLLALDQAGIAYQCMAPNIEQMHVINHLTGDEMPETRNVLVESARLARGEIIDVAEANVDDYNGLVFPGGFGAAKNLSDFAVEGEEMRINAQVAEFSKAMNRQGKVIGMMCIAPVMAAKLFGEGVECTVGNDVDTAAAIDAMGGQHQVCSFNECHIDTKNKLVSTPAYMLAGSLSEASQSVNRLVAEVIKLL